MRGARGTLEETYVRVRRRFKREGGGTGLKKELETREQESDRDSCGTSGEPANEGQ